MTHGHYYRRSARCYVHDVICFIHAEGKSTKDKGQRTKRGRDSSSIVWCDNVMSDSCVREWYRKFGNGALMSMAKVVNDDTQLWLMNSFKNSKNACLENVVSRYQKFLKNSHKFRGLLCIEFSRTDGVTISSVHGAYQNNWLTITKLKVCGQPSGLLGRGGRISWQIRDWWRDLFTFVNAETNQQSRQWMHTHSSNKPKKFKQTLSNKKMMATVFWDRKGILLTECMAPGTTITSEVYCETLNKLRKLIQNKRRGMLTKVVVLLHDISRPHSAARTNALIKLFNWQIV